MFFSAYTFSYFERWITNRIAITYFVFRCMSYESFNYFSFFSWLRLLFYRYAHIVYQVFLLKEIGLAWKKNILSHVLISHIEQTSIHIEVSFFSHVYRLSTPKSIIKTQGFLRISCHLYCGDWNKTIMLILKIFLVLFLVHSTYQLDNGLGRTPQMGEAHSCSLLAYIKTISSYRMEQLESFWMQHQRKTHPTDSWSDRSHRSSSRWL